jgi:hypothetical protein
MLGLKNWNNKYGDQNFNYGDRIRAGKQAGDKQRFRKGT